MGCLLLAVGVAVFYLYSGMEWDYDGDSAKGPVVLTAVPSDAAMVACGTVAELCPFNDPSFDAIKKHKMSISLHYSGKFHSLYAVDLNKADELEASAVRNYLSNAGAEYVQEGNILLISSSSNILKSASRHLTEGVSILDNPGFVHAYESVKGDVALIVSGDSAKRLLTSAFTSKLSTCSAFITKVADWYALRIDDDQPLSFDGYAIYDGEPDEFVTSFQNCNPGESSVAEYLPSFTISVLSLPMKNHATFRKDYQQFLDSRGKLKSMQVTQSKLERKYSISPMELFDKFEVLELATATLPIDGSVEQINLIHIDSRNAELIFADPRITSLRGYEPAVHEWKYPSFVSSVYGDLFKLKDESCFTFIDEWLIIGSRKAVEEYVLRDALHYTLKEYASHAGERNLLSAKSAYVMAYFSLTAQKERLSDYMKKGFLEGVRDYVGDPQYCPAVLYISKSGDRISTSLALHSLSLSRTKAPVHDRDNTVAVPEGPFQIVAPKGGVVYTFYQNRYKSLCLRDENGKDLWGVPFDKTICGCATGVDFYSNGKCQIVFCAENKLYIIDKTGRYLPGYPISLSKDVLIGPGLYDCTGNGKYSLIVLHADNTLEMYDLRGNKSQAWKTISVEKQTIKALPTILEHGNKRYLVVRTSVQTLIYPVSGGNPITKYKGDEMIMPDSDIIINKDNKVEATCYDGKTRTLPL